MRLFLGVDLPEEVKKHLFESLEPLRRKHPDFRWVKPQNYHLTIHFFGDVHQPKEVSKRLKDIFYDAKSFYMYSIKMDVFVNKHLNLYMEFNKDKKLMQLVEKIYADLDVDEKNSFLPHVSLSRSALSSKQQYFALNREIERMKIDVEFNVEKVYLFESIITEKQPTYTKVAEFKLLP